MDDLRIASAPRGPEIRILINGKAHRAFAGESVHAALLAAGYRVLRKTSRRHRPRGIFCGMGTCYDCLVTIDGIPDRQACMTRVEDGMEIELDG